ncbi:aldo/keto reductase [Salinibacterium sp. ZJ77]|uniref:aldo/keto reductase n=1 Tax=Salinibacterium sp. ZJ77 TaxID=2708337 RepID=UPI00142241F4|nr:aldo/keto reductase [Salinibacterium sp. ZJ77]
MTPELITLNDGTRIPQLGFGVYQIPAEDCERTVREAIDIGYRHFDTAQIYENEAEVGRALAASGIDRSEFFVTTKLWNPWQGRDTTATAFDESLRKLDMDYVDLFLIHWPMPKRDLYLETWDVMQSFVQDGRARSIGVSNFLVPHLERLLEHSDHIPSVNQIELHPAHQQPKLVELCAEKGIAIEAYAPLGQGAYPLLSDPTITAIADAHGRTPAQTVLRWHLQRGNIIFPKSLTSSRIRENFAIFDFTLSDDEVGRITAMECGGRVSHDPNDIN